MIKITNSISSTMSSILSSSLTMLTLLMSTSHLFKTSSSVEDASGVVAANTYLEVAANTCPEVAVNIEGTTAGNVATTTREAEEVTIPITSKIKQTGVKIVTSKTINSNSITHKRNKMISRLFKIPHSSVLRVTVEAEVAVNISRETIIVVITAVVVAKHMTVNKLTAKSHIISIITVVVEVIVATVETEVTEVTAAINVVSISRTPTSKEVLADTTARRRLARVPHWKPVTMMVMLIKHLIRLINDK